VPVQGSEGHLRKGLGKVVEVAAEGSKGKADSNLDNLPAHSAVDAVPRRSSPRH
jgi:hypothetical protein